MRSKQGKTVVLPAEYTSRSSSGHLFTPSAVREIDRQETNVMGISTSYYTIGDNCRRPLLLVHGMTTSADSFREIMYGLANDYQLIAPDLPGFGYSELIHPFGYERLASWLANFCQEMKLQSVDLIGHSFGGVVALCFAASFPSLVSRMLLAAPPVYKGDSYPFYFRRLLLFVRAHVLIAYFSKKYPFVHRRVRAPFHRPDLVDESVFSRRTQDYRRARASAGAIEAVALSDLSSCVENARKPICLVWGENDDVVPLDDARRLAAELDDATVETIPECGHVTIAEQPQQFVRIARTFFA
jgi:pimeloyl-ACP methyl ester carboxylesterase